MSQWKVRDVSPAAIGGYMITVAGAQEVPVFTSRYRTAEQAFFAAAMIDKALEHAVAVDKG